MHCTALHALPVGQSLSFVHPSVVTAPGVVGVSLTPGWGSPGAMPFTSLGLLVPAAAAPVPVGAALGEGLGAALGVRAAAPGSPVGPGVGAAGSVRVGCGASTAP